MSALDKLTEKQTDISIPRYARAGKYKYRSLDLFPKYDLKVARDECITQAVQCKQI